MSRAKRRMPVDHDGARGARQHPVPDWTQLSPATSPPPRAYGAMTFDSATGQVVLFSGSENALKSFPTTTWAWNGATWSQI
jgi:hypothetical protein